MKILFTGGGTGGHFYPIIAVAEELNQLAIENHLLRPELFYMSTEPYNESLLFENNITFVPITAGKIRRDTNVLNLILNFVDIFKIFVGCLSAIWKMFVIFPDVVFGKGAYVSFPALFAARIFRIPVVIHESDSHPGRVNNWAGKFAKRIAVSYPDAVKYFVDKKVAYTGNPIRKEVREPMTEGAYKLLELDEVLPTILILGGSQGSKTLNDAILTALPDLVKKYQIIHQTGRNNIKVVEETKEIVLQNSQFKHRYKPFAYLNILNLRASAGVANLIISRSGSTIFEIASWGKPAILIPIPETTSHDQRSNAYSYARTGSAIVIEEKNLGSRLLIAEIDRILESKSEQERMSKCAKEFARQDSAKLIAQEILSIALEHEK